jgi:S-adenosyl methyltransferase
MLARFTRGFIIDTVDDLAAGHGIRQSLDIGTGLPAADNAHDVAQSAAPDSRIVYVDHDPIVLQPRPDSDDPYAIVTRPMDAVPSGSYSLHEIVS